MTFHKKALMTSSHALPRPSKRSDAATAPGARAPLELKRSPVSASPETAARASGTDCSEAVRGSAVLLCQTQPQVAVAPPAHLVDALRVVDAQAHLWQEGQGPLHADTSARGRAVNQRDRSAPVDAGLPPVANPHLRTVPKN